MFKQKNLLFLVAAFALCAPQVFMAETPENEGPLRIINPAFEDAHKKSNVSSDDIKPDCKDRFDSQAGTNPLEQFITDYCTSGGYDYWVKTPNRSVPLVQISRKNYNDRSSKISHIRFEIPYRIDMHSDYSHQI